MSLFLYSEDLDGVLVYICFLNIRSLFNFNYSFLEETILVRSCIDVFGTSLDISLDKFVTS